MPDTTGGYKVLLVNGDHSISDALAQIFSLHGYLVKTAYYAEQAIEIVADWNPALAIVDVALPKMDGIELAILLRENSPSCHVLLVSGQLIAAGLEEETDPHGHILDSLIKPVGLNDLLKSASALLSAKAKPDA